MMASASALLVATALAFAPAGETVTARKLFDAGSIAYARGRYDDATRAFTAAYEILPDPAIAFSLAQARRRQYFVDHDRSDLTAAIDLYHRYLAEVPEGGRRADAVEQLQALEGLRASLEEDDTTSDDDDTAVAAPSTELMIYASAPDAVASVDDGPFVAVPAIVATAAGDHGVRVKAPGYVAVHARATAVLGRMMPLEVQLAPEPARLELRTRPGATIHVDGRELGRAPMAPIELSAGRHVVAVWARGRVATSRTLEFQRGQVRKMAVDLPRTPQRVAAWALLGTSAGLWVAGGTTLGLAFTFQGRARRIEDLWGERNISEMELQRLDDSLWARDRLRGATIGLWTGAAVTAIVSVVLVFTDRG